MSMVVDQLGARVLPTADERASVAPYFVVLCCDADLRLKSKDFVDLAGSLVVTR
jgi:hypothetical protein